MKAPNHMARVAALGCCVCKRPAEVHHIRLPPITGASDRADDMLTMPLCPTHHRGALGFHRLGRKKWEKLFGEQIDFVCRTLNELYE